MAFQIHFNEEKNQLLKATRGISFEDVIDILEHEKMLDDISHPSKRHAKQRMYVIVFNNYVYAVPYVMNEQKQEIFLKTIYASRVLNKRYLKGARK